MAPRRTVRALAAPALVLVAALIGVPAASAAPLVGNIAGAGVAMVVSPTSLTAGATGATLTFNYTAPDAAVPSVAVTIPAGFPAPQTSASDAPGYASATKGTCAKARVTIIGSKIKDTAACPIGGSFTLTYANVTAPTTAGTYKFTTTAAGLGAVAAQPAVKVLHGLVAGISVSPQSATLEAANLPTAPANAFWNETAPLATFQDYTISTVDQYGNKVGNVSSTAGLSISGPADDTTAFCATGATPGCGALQDQAGYQVTATYKRFHATADLNGGYGDLVMGCVGENYDVDGATADGCEIAQPNPGATQSSTARSGGTVSNCDSPGSSFTASVITDARTHVPAIPGFVANEGTAPEFYQVTSGNNPICTNDIVLTISELGSTQPTCYQLKVTTDLVSHAVQLNSAGTASMNFLGTTTPQFTGGQPVLFEIQKTCINTLPENVQFSVSFHL